MAASANPSGADENAINNVPSALPMNNTNNGNTVVVDTNTNQPTQIVSGLRHNPGFSTDWSSEEQSLLEELLITYASEKSVLKYAKIAMQLEDKTVRDVALRCRWMTKKEFGKRRKEDHSSAKRHKEKKEKGGESSAKHASRQGAAPYVSSMMPMENDGGISFKDIGGVTGQLLEQNDQLLRQISGNLSSYQIHENINLFCQTRDNLFNILNSLNDMPQVMKQMPALPVKVNEELVKAILPPSQLQMRQ